MEHQLKSPSDQTESSNTIPLLVADPTIVDVVVAEIVIEPDSESDESFQPPMPNTMERYRSALHDNASVSIDPYAIKPKKTVAGFQCPICQRVIQLKKHFARHAQTHSGLKMFNCDLCDYGTNRKDHMLAHTSKHTGMKPFDCPICEYCSTRRDHLNKHIKSIHFPNSKDSSSKRKKAVIK